MELLVGSCHDPREFVKLRAKMFLKGFTQQSFWKVGKKFFSKTHGCVKTSLNGFQKELLNYSLIRDWVR